MELRRSFQRALARLVDQVGDPNTFADLSDRLQPTVEIANAADLVPQRLHSVNGVRFDVPAVAAVRGVGAYQAPDEGARILFFAGDTGAHARTFDAGALPALTVGAATVQNLFVPFGPVIRGTTTVGTTADAAFALQGIEIPAFGLPLPFQFELETGRIFSIYNDTLNAGMAAWFTVLEYPLVTVA